MSRVVLFVFVVALAGYSAGFVLTGETSCTTPNKKWYDCAIPCNKLCVDVDSKPEDWECSRTCQPGCFCESGYLEAKNGSCISSNWCYTYLSYHDTLIDLFGKPEEYENE